MSTRVQTLIEGDKESHQILLGMCIGKFLDGECYAFATALHRGLGWPMIGLLHEGKIRHVAVKSPDGKLHDARGYIIEDEFGFGAPFGICAPYDLKAVHEADLMREGEPVEFRERSIRMATRFAEALWPELPWRDSLASRVSEFASELETLSRKHKLWIRSPVPAAKPLIAVGEDDEGGYAVSITLDGLAFTIDRYFK